MQRRYTGDVGDFGKYGLLRALCVGDPQLSLGVNWYLVDAEELHNADGKHSTYLNDTPASRLRYRRCDERLYEALQKIRPLGEDGVRRLDQLCVSLVQEGHVFPKVTKFYDAPLPVAIGRTTGEQRQAQSERRRQWHRIALEAMSGVDVVFVDPDNGLLRKGDPVHGVRGHKYASLDEISDYVGRGQSVVAYHHMGRQLSHAEQIQFWLDQIARDLKTGISPWGLHYKRGTGRCYFVIPATKTHRELLWARSQVLSRVPWDLHFRLHVATKTV
jgi:hypothetical protein